MVGSVGRAVGLKRDKASRYADEVAVTTEESTIKEITPLPLEGNIQVLRQKKVLQEGEVISSVDHYTLYSVTQKEQFLAEVAVEGTEQYVAAVGW